MRIATACIRGRPAKSRASSKQQGGLLLAIACDIHERGWRNLDCLVLPGGFFWHHEHLGLLDEQSRLRRIQATDFSDACMAAARLIAPVGRRRTTLVVAGVDARRKGKWKGDEFCVAWNARGIAGIGRKVFPPPSHDNGGANAVASTKQIGGGIAYSCETDFSSPSRVVGLPNGSRALLCACYDMYGVRPPDDIRGRIRNVRWLVRRGNSKPGKAEKAELNQYANRWRALWHGSVNLGLSAVHNDPGAYWQRHGIQRCSRELGGYALAAAHFDRKPLPSAITRLPLAGTKGRRMSAEDEIRREDYLVRLFEWDFIPALNVNR